MLSTFGTVFRTLISFCPIEIRNSQPIYCKCPQDSLTIRHCPVDLSFYWTFCPGLLQTIGHLRFLIGKCPTFSIIGTQLKIYVLTRDRKYLNLICENMCIYVLFTFQGPRGITNVPTRY